MFIMSSLITISFRRGKWHRAKFLDNPTIELQLSVTKSDYKALSLPVPLVSPAGVTAKLDTCAQSCLWSLQECLSFGFKQEDLIPVHISMSAANKSKIVISGAILARLQATLKDGRTVSCSTMVYVSPSAEGFFLSLEAMLDLGMITPESDFYPSTLRVMDHAQLSAKNCSLTGDRDRCSTENCSCPSRSHVPCRPSCLPFSPDPENNSLMREWLLKKFGSSTFNTCTRQPLPAIDKGPPLQLHVDPLAKPKACHTPAPIPLHWQEQVHSDLLRDEALGVIEKVPYGEPVEWCHRMVITRKHDGSPRRTVDLSPLNKHCKRETFSSESPFHTARRIPKDTWKTVTDAWNGFHGIEIRECDRPLTTFITPYGRFRYKRAPQGYVSSGDGFNRRIDEILTDFNDKERCIDDICHFDDNLEQHWWRTIDLLISLGEAGVVVNPDKFQFAQQTVEFAGFRITPSSTEPLPKYLDAIRDFPTPKNTSDIRSWFGLVNQVSNYAQLRDLMAPFKPFLSPRCPFSWNEELNSKFEESKLLIIEAICKGVEIFDVTKRTCLRPDWSKKGIGYFLSQKHCPCQSDRPGCCDDGWKVTLVGSRFLRGPELRYAPVEGESLALAWSLEQSRYFTLGCDDLLVVTDHKPLIKIFGDRTLDEINNSRMFRLKQRTLPWHFDIIHMPGKSNAAADATSRYPCEPSSEYISLLSQEDENELAFVASISRNVSELTTISWERLVSETAGDAVLTRLLEQLNAGFPETLKELDPVLHPFFRIRESLFFGDGVVMCNDRVIVPESLRKDVLDILHSAHQGVSSMESRAQCLLYWPGMHSDIASRRNNCSHCCRNAPSNASLPPKLADIPSTPFESVFADYFDVSNYHYLVAGDRLSGWVEVFSSSKGSSNSGASGLQSHLRSLFATFGVPEKISSDGGSEFVASSTKEFFKKWGVDHRLSSAYFPQSNGRAEVAVKKVKRFIGTCIGPSGSLNTDKFLQGMLQLRNTPDPDCKLSPAQILFGRPLRDAFSFVNRVNKFRNEAISPVWKDAWRSKEEALRTRFVRSFETLGEKTRALPDLFVGDRVFIQNQTGPHPKKWDRSGVVMELRGNDQYLIKVDGTGRLSIRNRRFLKKYTLALPLSNPVVHEPSGYPSTSEKFVPRDQTSDPVPIDCDSELSPVVPSEGNDQGSQVDLPSIPDPVVTHLPDWSGIGTTSDSCESTVNSDTPASQMRPKRDRVAPKRYVPETGAWE